MIPPLEPVVPNRTSLDLGVATPDDADQPAGLEPLPLPANGPQYPLARFRLPSRGLNIYVPASVRASSFVRDNSGFPEPFLAYFVLVQPESPGILHLGVLPELDAQGGGGRRKRRRRIREGGRAGSTEDDEGEDEGASEDDDDLEVLVDGSMGNGLHGTPGGAPSIAESLPPTENAPPGSQHPPQHGPGGPHHPPEMMEPSWLRTLRCTDSTIPDTFSLHGKILHVGPLDHSIAILRSSDDGSGRIEVFTTSAMYTPAEKVEPPPNSTARRIREWELGHALPLNLHGPSVPAGFFGGMGPGVTGDIGYPLGIWEPPAHMATWGGPNTNMMPTLIQPPPLPPIEPARRVSAGESSGSSPEGVMPRSWTPGGDSSNRATPGRSDSSGEHPPPPLQHPFTLPIPVQAPPILARPGPATPPSSLERRAAFSRLQTSIFNQSLPITPGPVASRPARFHPYMAQYQRHLFEHSHPQPSSSRPLLPPANMSHQHKSLSVPRRPAVNRTKETTATLHTRMGASIEGDFQHLGYVCPVGHDIHAATIDDVSGKIVLVETSGDDYHVVVLDYGWDPHAPNLVS